VFAQAPAPAHDQLPLGEQTDPRSAIAPADRLAGHDGDRDDADLGGPDADTGTVLTRPASPGEYTSATVMTTAATGFGDEDDDPVAEPPRAESSPDAPLEREVEGAIDPTADDDHPSQRGMVSGTLIARPPSAGPPRPAQPTADVRLPPPAHREVVPDRRRYAAEPTRLVTTASASARASIIIASIISALLGLGVGYLLWGVQRTSGAAPAPPAAGAPAAGAPASTGPSRPAP
jgi:hypothetical protein